MPRSLRNRLKWLQPGTAETGMIVPQLRDSVPADPRCKGSASLYRDSDEEKSGERASPFPLHPSPFISSRQTSRIRWVSSRIIPGLDAPYLTLGKKPREQSTTADRYRRGNVATRVLCPPCRGGMLFLGCRRSLAILRHPRSEKSSSPSCPYYSEHCHAGWHRLRPAFADRRARVHGRAATMAQSRASSRPPNRFVLWHWRGALDR
mgnify:CR=1 FL=1